MLGKTHIVNSLAISSSPLILNNSFQLNIEYIFFLMCVAIGSVIPDIDEPSSIIGRKVKPFAYVINIFFGHRTITHNLLFFGITLCILLYIQKYQYILALNIGIVLHILQDSITYQGIRNGLFPIQRFSYNFVLLPRYLRFAVGSLTEYIILVVSALFFIVVLFNQLSGI